MGVSLGDDTKRTDYPGKEIARLVQNKWNDNFINEIKIVVGNEWAAETYLIIYIQDLFGEMILKSFLKYYRRSGRDIHWKSKNIKKYVQEYLEL